ncbi:MAG: phosphopentomutase, partial [Eubacteriales bacterium]|nr:phosphopentomutase [Eubacteriales bacterium]
MKTKRVFLIVLDSCGAGELPDAAQFGDVGANTLRSVSRSEKLCIPTLRKLGIGNIHGLDFLGTTPEPLAAVGRLAEQSRGKDTTTGHWEIAGIISKQAMPTYPNGFPDDVISEFAAATGRGVLCNKPYSGTQVIHDYGREQLATGKLIVYTSADSVFQIAAHEDMIPVEQLYEYCRMARRILTGKNAVGR